MARGKPRRLKKRIFTSYLTSTVSITLVLFLLGLLSLVMLNAERLTNYVREKIGFTLMLNHSLSDAEISRLESLLEAQPYVRAVTFIDKEEAAVQLAAELGEDFVGFLGYNPLFDAIEIKLNADWTHPDSLVVLESRLTEFPQVKEVFYQKSLVSVINENVRKLGIFLLIFSGLMLFVFSVLINNTIRISMYAQRFIINNMLLVGATHRFVRRPFVRKSLMFGFYGGLIANLLLGAIMITYKKELSGVINQEDIIVLGIVAATVFATGFLITWLSTRLAVNRFLRMRFEDLFY